MKNTRAFLSFLRGSSLLHATFATASIVVCMAPSNLVAAITVWDGNATGASDLGTAANWNPDGIPSVVTPDTVQWNNTATGPLSLVYSDAAFQGAAGNPGLNFDLSNTQTSPLSIDSGLNPAFLRLNNITIASGAGAFTLGDGSDAFNLTLGGAAGTHNWTNDSSNPATISSDVTFGLGGAGAHVLSLAGAGNWQLNNNITPQSGTLTIAKSGLGTATLAGTIPSNTTTITGFQINGGTINLAKDVPLAGSTLVNGSGGTINATGGGKILLNVAGGDFGVSNSGTLTVNSIIAPGSVGSIDFWNTTSGTGVVVLNAANTFDGITNLQSGIISVGTIGNSGVAGNLGKSGIFNLAATTSATTLRYTGGGETNDRVLNLAGTTGGATIEQAGTGLLKFASNMTATGVGTKTLNLSGSTSGSGEIAGAVVSNGVTALTKSGTGTWSLSSSSNAINGLVNVAGGTLNVSGTLGTNTSIVGFQVGSVANTKAVLNILPGAVLNNRFTMFVGDGGSGTGGGAVYQSGGSLTLTQAAGIDNLRIGSNGGGYGYYNLSGTGTVTANRPAIGASLADTVGVVDISGGAFTANEQLHVAAGSATTSGLLNVTGGSVSAGTDIRMLVGGNATSVATVNVGGGVGLASITTGNAASTGVNLAQTNNVAGALGVVNLLPNGTLNTGRILGSQANAITHLNFNGGTLKATPINTGTGFITDANLDAVNVFSGGGTIDNNNTAITISKALLLPTGSGISAVTVSNGGSGYIGAPLVKISGGSGTGATAYATVSGGAVTAVTVTGRGIGYQNTDTLTVTFFGGGGTGAAASISGAQITPNTSGGMTFAGGASGATILTGISTYTGATTVSTGRLFVNGSLAAGSAVSVASGATLGGTGTISGTATVAAGGNIEAGQSLTGKTTFGGLAFSGAANVNFGNLSNYTATTGISAGSLTTSGPGAVVINIASLGSATAPHVYKLIDFTSNPGGLSGLTLAPLPSRGVGSLQLNGSQIDLQLTGLDFLKWTGNASSAWNTAAINWKLNSTNSPTAYINTPGDSVVFDDSAGSNTTVDISTADVTPTSVIFNNNLQDYLVQGSKGITGVTTLIKNDGADLTLATSNSYSGATTLNAGTLNINNASAIGTGTFNLNGGAIDTTSGAVVLTTNNVQNWNTDVVFGGTNSLDLGTGAVTIPTNRMVTTNGGGTLTVGGVIGGTGFSLTKEGPGTLVLGGVNTYTGGTVLNSGTLQVNQTTGAANTGTITYNGGNLIFNPPANNFNYAAPFILNTDGFISKIGAFQINYTGILTGNNRALNVSTNATSRFYLNSAATNLTQINITGGAMGFDLNVGNRGGGAPVIVSSGAALWFANATNVLANNITLNGGAGQGGGAILQEGNGTPTISSPILLAGGDSSIGSTSANGLTSVITATGPITGSGSLTKLGTNKLTFSGANEYTGSTTVNAGTLAAGVASVANVSGAFGKNSAVVMGNFAGAILDITGFPTQIGSISGGGAAGGNVTLGAANLTVGGDNSSPLAYGGAIAGTGSLIKTGIGTQILSGLSSFTGDLLINNGTLAANRGNNLVNPVTSAVGNNQVVRSIILSGASTFQFVSGDTLGGNNSNILSKFVIGAGSTVTNAGGVFNRLGSITLNGGTLASVSGAAAGYQTYSLDAAAVVTVGGSTPSTISTDGTFPGIHLNAGNVFDVADATTSPATDLTVSAPLINRNDNEGGVTSPAGLTKSGVGTMKLTGASSYTGPTTINAGRLDLTGSLGNTAVAVNAGGTLSGTGSIAGTVSINADGRFAGDIAATPGAQIPLTITGALTINSGNFIDLSAAATPSTGVYVLATATGGLTFTPGTVTLAGVSGVVSKSGNDLILTVSSNDNYTTWANSKSLTGLNNGATLDPDNDGISNLLEFILGGNPLTSDTPSIMPALTLDASNFYFTFNRADESEAQTVQTFQYGTNLTGWSDVTIGAISVLPVVSITENAGAAPDTVVITIPRSNAVGGKLFGRLKAVK